MTDQAMLVGAFALIAASVARDLDEAGLLSDASRKTIHAGLGEIRGSIAVDPAAPDQADDQVQLALRILDRIVPAADG